ncbi:PAS domain-containing protein, partial [Streptomyces sp. NPDC056730]
MGGTGPRDAGGAGDFSGPFPEWPSGVLDALGVAVVALGRAGRIILWGARAEELFGYSAREALGRHAARLLADDRCADLVAGRDHSGGPGTPAPGPERRGLRPYRNHA